jgi:sortase A
VIRPIPRRWRVLAFSGRWATVLGLLTIGFATWQTWGTALLAERTQGQLETAFEQLLEQAPGSPFELDFSLGPGASEPSTESDQTEADSPSETLGVRLSEDGMVAHLVAPLSSPVARLRIPSINLDRIVVLGDRRGDLQKGPGLAATRAAPGSATGNAVIAGHRSTYGAPFFDFDRISLGDQIFVDTTYGTFTYRVQVQEVVSPRDPRLMAETLEPQLTLYTCNPKYSSKQRILVVAVPDSPLAPLPIGIEPGGDAAVDLAASLTGGPELTEEAELTEVAEPTEEQAGPGELVPGEISRPFNRAAPAVRADLEAERAAELESEQRWSRDPILWASVLLWFAGFALLRHCTVRLWVWRRLLAAPVLLLWLPMVLGLYRALGHVIPAGI